LSGVSGAAGIDDRQSTELCSSIRRVMKSGGMVALGFTPRSLQSKQGLIETITAAGFVRARMVKTKNFCVSATKP
jgi:hypothetical protein